MGERDVLTPGERADVEVYRGYTAPALVAIIDRLVAEVERLGRIIDDSFGYLPPVGSMAFSDRLLTPHAVAVADEFAVISRQLEAFRSSDAELRARNEALEQVAKLPDLRWPHIVSPCACCEDLRQQWKALAEPGKGGAT